MILPQFMRLYTEDLKKWSKFKNDGGDISSLQDKKKSTLENDLLTDWPDLIMIDGGKGQLNAALKALTQLDLHEEVNICSLAKKNRRDIHTRFFKIS